MALWQWSKRRHPNKGKRWIKAKYFKGRDQRNWCFKTQTQTSKEIEVKELFKTTDVSIKRHVKVKAASNPYDKEWQSYFIKRLQPNGSSTRICGIDSNGESYVQ